LNLLTGLAVGETQRIQEQAEVLGYVSQIKLMFYLEAMLFRDPENAFSRFQLKDRLLRMSRNFVTLKFYSYLSRTPGTRKSSFCPGRSLIDCCPGFGWVGALLDKIGSFSMLFHTEPEEHVDAEMKEVKVMNNEFNRIPLTDYNSPSPHDIYTISLKPFEDFHKRVEAPHNDIALSDSQANSLISYISDMKETYKRSDIDLNENIKTMKDKLSRMEEELKRLNNMVSRSILAGSS
jgi:lipid II:glycine glycyltransferase (peptidoglycan interpeptide bridge formation enzyme)